ncbi:MAG TPA: type II toxin-antitoxin system VapC family toxin [Dongiaceae bacterium]|jgi:predicted nucleic acid-binding protein|nr:type II toxin-antitoxin system VapC family toxin [Dongiaceae bacterium]
MSLVVDASVVIKWFINEPLHDHARQLLKGRQSLHAPDLLLAEIGNIAWKKVIRGEIDEKQAQKITQSLRDLPIILQSSEELISRALQMALSIKHPVYDCLYLACAEALGGTFVTADERLGKALAGTILSALYRNLSDQYSIAVSAETVEELARQFKRAEATSENIHKILRPEARVKVVDSDEVDIHLNSPAYRRLHKAILALSESEQIDLLALGWLGQGYSGSDWFELQNKARQSLLANTDPKLIYLLSMTVYFESGWNLLQAARAESKKK